MSVFSLVEINIAVWEKVLRRAKEGKGIHLKRKGGRCEIHTNPETKAGVRVHFPLVRTDNECMRSLPPKEGLEGMRKDA